MSPRARRFPFGGGFESILRLWVSSVCVGALSTSRIDKRDSSGFPSDVSTASLGLFIKIQDYIDSLVHIGIYKPRASSSHDAIARTYNFTRALACMRPV